MTAAVGTRLSQAEPADRREPLLSVEGLAVEVPTRRGPVPVVNGITFNVAAGEALGVVGESGCGKSITMLGLLGLLPLGARVSHGSALFEGADLLAMRARDLRAVRGGRVGMVFQDPMTSFNPVLRLGDQIAEPLIYHRRLSRKAARRRAGELLRLVGIPGGERRLDNYPHELSGGMRQRAMIAIGLACEPSLLIADEPTTALDATTQAQIVDLVKDLRARRDMAIVWITHDLALVSGLVDRLIVIYAGTIVEEAPVDSLYASPTHPYTRGLLASLPRIDGTGQRRLPSIGGTPPEPGRAGPGCPFAARCASRIDRCTREVPTLAAVIDGHPGHRAACFVTAPAVETVQ